MPQLILLGNLLFPILVYGYFISSVHAHGAAVLLLELAAVAIISAQAGHIFLVPYVLQDVAAAEQEQAAVLVSVACWIASWALQLALLARYNTAPENLEDCASERLRLAVELGRANSNNPDRNSSVESIATVEEEAAVLLETAVAEIVEGTGQDSDGRTAASFMVARTAVCKHATRPLSPVVPLSTPGSVLEVCSVLLIDEKSVWAHCMSCCIACCNSPKTNDCIALRCAVYRLVAVCGAVGGICQSFRHWTSHCRICAAGSHLALAGSLGLPCGRQQARALHVLLQQGGACAVATAPPSAGHGATTLVVDSRCCPGTLR